VGRIEDKVNTCPSIFIPRPDQIPEIPFVVTVVMKLFCLDGNWPSNNSGRVGVLTLFHTESSHPAVMIIDDNNATAAMAAQVILSNDFIL
jgi:hypothetical protein